MTFAVTVTNPHTGQSWNSEVPTDEVDHVRNNCRGYETYNILSALLRPVRTNNIENFCKDFFLPTTINSAIKVESVVGRIFAILGSLILDLPTLPIRLLTAIPRIIENSKRPEHPLRTFLREKEIDPAIYNTDYVKVKTEWVTTDRFNYSQYTDRDGVVHRRQGRSQNYNQEYVALIELPDSVKPFSFQSGSHSI